MFCYGSVIRNMSLDQKKMPMKKKTLSLFPKDKRKKLSRQKTDRKEKEDMIEVLAAEIFYSSSKLSKKEKFQMTG